MYKNFKKYSKIFWELLKTDLIVFGHNLIGNIIDCIIWVTLTMFVFAYIFPSLGMTKDYGALWLGSAIASWAIFEAWPSILTFISDIKGNNSISYELTLPIPSWLIIIKRILGYTINSMAITLIILPLGKLILWNNISFANFNILKFILIFITINIFASTFAHFLTSLIPSLERIGTAWMRILFPMWFLGGAQFPWYAINQMSPKLGKISLLNPIIYMMEGSRASILGQQNFISLWYCLLALWGFTFIFGTIAIIRIKKRLDFI